MYDVKKIYKYMSFKAAVRLFESQHIRITEPSSLNDIFENPVEKNNPWSRYGNDIQDLSITSYTETPTNLLMWSHYADQYKGVVIGFSTDHMFFDNLKRVRYHEHQGTGKNQPEDTILLKGNDWMYEKEWRQLWKLTSQNRNTYEILDGEITYYRHEEGHDLKDAKGPDNHIYLRKIPIEVITDVIYGPRFLQDKVGKNFKKTLTKDHPDIKQKEAITAEGRFALKIS